MSHTPIFFPPSRAAEVDYGWVVEMFGDDCYVTHIKPKSDAEAKGLKVGDKLLAIDNFKPTRKNMWQMDYRYYAVAPAAKVTMTLLSPGDAKPHILEIQTKIMNTGGVVSLQSWYDKAVIKHGWFDMGKVNEYQQFGDDLLIWKMHSFAQPEASLDAALAKARKCKWLILDLRDNGGGYVDITKRLIGYFFDKEIKIGDEITRKETKPRVVKSHGGDLFTGNLIVLVDHGSASASEVFSKVVQLEKRGKIIGDKTAGAVMTSKFYQMDNGFGNNLWFGASVTMADLIMADGKSLEKVGVMPDEIVLPTGKDLAESKDPVMSYAAKLCGVEIAPEKAGAFFPFEWPK